MYKHLNISITLCGEETCTDELQISLMTLSALRMSLGALVR